MGRIEEKDWNWTGYAGHFCAADRCKFKLRTEVGNFVISTVGGYYSDMGLEEIGFGRFFETMVFKLSSELCSCGCGERKIQDLREIDFAGYNDARSAKRGHMEMCYKYALIGGDE